jgi:hypothetical protein
LILIADVAALIVLCIYAWRRLRTTPSEAGPTPRPTPIQAVVVIAGIVLFAFAGRCG